MLELFLGDRWKQLTGQLREARPSYIFVSAAYPEVIRERSPEMMRLVEDDYTVFHQNSAGFWYFLRSDK